MLAQGGQGTEGFRLHDRHQGSEYKINAFSLLKKFGNYWIVL